MKIQIEKIISILFLILLFWMPFSGNSQSIVNTRHNLSVSGTGSVKAATETQICIFCHTPHGGNPIAPLWNRNSSGAVYTLYSSSTLNALPGQPDGSSVLCLSCHDGTIALGSVINPSSAIVMVGNMSSGNLTTDLSNDHPGSFLYDAALSASDGQLKAPPLSTVKLDANSKVQCSSCHDPHKDIYTKFLRETNDGSALCFLCHDRTFWSSSTHSTSTNIWNGSGTNPWAHIEFPFNTVARNACENCHDPHNAGGKIRLLKSSTEEGNCLDCHSGTVASSSKNISAQFAKAYKHDVAAYSGIHDPTEAISVLTGHVECVDCHNPHASNATTANAPNINGSQTAVSGIDQSGNPVNIANFAYEVCYKCHAGNAWAPASSTTRAIVQNNVRLEFATTNPSYHPVVGPGVGTNVPSLIAPFTTASVIYCTDCHGSDGAGSPEGPHGSIYPQILKKQYSKTDGGSFATGTPESASAYALCYSCHDRNSILNDDSFVHNAHVVGQRVPCNTCHDPHGISSSQGTVANNTHLINFNTGPVLLSAGNRRFVDGTPGNRYCELRCHSITHDNSMVY